MCDTKQIQESQRTPSRIYSKITIPRHIIFKLQKPKDKKKKLSKKSWCGHGTLRIEEQRGELNVTCPQKSHDQEESGLKYLQC